MKAYKLTMKKKGKIVASMNIDFEQNKIENFELKADDIMVKSLIADKSAREILSLLRDRMGRNYDFEKMIKDSQRMGLKTPYDTYEFIIE